MPAKQIKYSELTFQAIVESTPNSIVLVNKEGKIAYINNQTERLFGYTRVELIGQQVEVLIPERYHKNHPGFRKMFFATPSVRAMGAGRELFAIRKDKTEFPIEIGLNPVITVDGTLVLASIIDISERQKAEERFRLVVESAPNAMILVNSEGVITLVNTQTEKLFGFERKELIGNKLELLIPKKFRGSHPSHRQGFYKKPSVRSMGEGRDLFAARKDGSEVQVEIGLNPIETAEGKMVLASIIDITERKIQEALITKQVKELETKNKELEQFTYITSHDLQEPLRTVSNYIQVLEEDYNEILDEEGRKYLKTIDNASMRMKALVKGLLDYSRLGKNREHKKVSSDKVIHDAIADLENLIKKTKTKITIPKNLPEITVTEIEFRQLFQNLIQNAIKFSKPAENPNITIDCTRKGQQWLFSITDNGIGIEPRNLKRIFDIFQRTEVTKDFDGYGIGLANCKKIVEVHHGKIWVESKLGHGSTFFFTFDAINND